MKRIFPSAMPDVDDLMDTVIARMKKVGPNSEEYPNLMRSLERLKALKTDERRKPLDWNTVVQTLGSLAGVVLVLNFERLGVVSSKAFGWLKRTAL